MASGTDVNVRDTLGQKPIVVAALAGQDAVAQVLMSYGADVMARTDKGMTPLHAAAFSGDLDILRLLLAGGAAINDQDNFAHITALHAAAEAVGKATLGDPAIAAHWLGAEWHLASAANRDTLMADPITYAPQYGGHCADGMACGTTAVQSNIDPNAWRVINRKLDISYDPVSATEFDTIPDLIQRADANRATYQEPPG